MCAQLLQSCPALWDPIDCSLPGSSVHGILQASILEWVSMPSSRGSGIPDPGIKPASLVSPALQAGSLPTEPPGKPQNMWILMSKLIKHYTLNTSRLMHANHNLIKWFFRKSVFYSKKKKKKKMLSGLPESCLLPTTPSHHTPKWDPSPNLWHHGFLLPVFALYVNATMQGVFFCA